MPKITEETQESGKQDRRRKGCESARTASGAASKEERVTETKKRSDTAETNSHINRGRMENLHADYFLPNSSRDLKPQSAVRKIGG